MNEDKQQPSFSSFTHYRGLGQLICVMLADPELAASILADPSKAVNELVLPIQLSPIERNLVMQVPQTDTVQDFATCMLTLLHVPRCFPLAEQLTVEQLDLRGDGRLQPQLLIKQAP
ncbi:MAG TPA: hypothetical protein VFS21_08545 [Roseiflexaceae bacterium]|nr:hypothetical protein [Roseiflexaceae bacterium]